MRLRLVVTAHGGTIRLQSSPGQGASFEVLLPTTPQDQQDALAPIEPTPAPARAHAEASLLLVEDNPDLRELGVMILSLHGYNVTAAQDAEEAMHVLPRRRFDTRPRQCIAERVKPALVSGDGDPCAETPRLLRQQRDVPRAGDRRSGRSTRWDHRHGRARSSRRSMPG